MPIPGASPIRPLPPPSTPNSARASSSATDDADRERRGRFAAVLGGAEDDAPVPSLTGGDYEGLPASADADLRQAIATDLTRAAHARRAPRAAGRTTRSRRSIRTTPAADAAVIAAAARWRIDLDRRSSGGPGRRGPDDRGPARRVVAALADRLSQRRRPFPRARAALAADEFINA